jgi:hypothetical protein
MLCSYYRRNHRRELALPVADTPMRSRWLLKVFLLSRVMRYGGCTVCNGNEATSCPYSLGHSTKAIGGSCMRALILLAVIVLVLALVGWISFNKGPDRTSINIESERIRQDTKQVMESGAQILHKAGDKAESSREPSHTPAANDPAPVSH